MTMNRSTRHAIAQRLVGLAGVTLFAGLLWFQALAFVPPAVQLLGLLMLAAGVFSGMGIGPWGSHYKKLLMADREAYLRSLEPRQPWQP